MQAISENASSSNGVRSAKERKTQRHTTTTATEHFREQRQQQQQQQQQQSSYYPVSMQSGYILHQLQSAAMNHHHLTNSNSSTRQQGDSNDHNTNYNIQMQAISTLPSIEHLAYRAGPYGYDQSMSGSHGSLVDFRSYGFKHPTDHTFTLPQGYQRPPQTVQQQNVCGNGPAFSPSQNWPHIDPSTMSLTQMPAIGTLSGTTPTHRQKRTRMSLQKRLLVNARERERMRVLNKAFEALRDALPCYIADGHMAKITTLRLAINYIKALSEVLKEQRELDEDNKLAVQHPKPMDNIVIENNTKGGIQKRAIEASNENETNEKKVVSTPPSTTAMKIKI